MAHRGWRAHLCSDAAGIIHQPADFPYETPVVQPGKRLLHEFVHVMHLTSKKGDIPRG